LGANNFNYNGAGLVILSKGLVAITGVTANGNGDAGIFVNYDTTADANVITLTNVTTRNNRTSGICLHTHGNITINNAVAIGNGIGLSGDESAFANGMYVRTLGAASTISILNSIALGNGGHGIWIMNPREPLGVVLTGTSYFGNNVDHYSHATNYWQNLYVTTDPF
jgi:hypothetical protein